MQHPNGGGPFEHLGNWFVGRYRRLEGIVTRVGGATCQWGRRVVMDPSARLEKGD